MYKQKQSIKTFTIQDNDRWVAVVQEPEWEYGHRSNTDTVVVFTRADRVIDEDHHLIPGPRFPLRTLLHRAMPLPLLGGDHITALSANVLGFGIEEWVRIMRKQREQEHE